MEVVPYRRRGRFIVPTADSSAIRTTPIHRPKHGGGKPRHYYTRTGGSRRHIVVAGLAPAMLSLSTLQGARGEASPGGNAGYGDTQRFGDTSN